MDPETLFDWAGRVAILGWLLLALAPRWQSGPRLIAGVLVPGLLGALYLAIVAGHLRPGGAGGFGSLGAVAALFQDPWMLLAGWVHYLCFDLFIGAWEVRDARRAGVHHVLMLPCLALTFLLGPVGLLAYLTLRTFKLRSLAVEAQVSLVRNAG